jgi:hypothetical protein
MKSRVCGWQVMVKVLVVGSVVVLTGGWRSALYPEDWEPPQEREGLNFLTSAMVQDFSFAGYHRGERMLPDVAGPVFNVLNYGADAGGAGDSTAAIQAAIEAAEAAGGGMVWLPEGRYLLSKPENRNYAVRITRSGVVLRGAGPDKTFLVNTTSNMRQSDVIKVGPVGGSNWATPRGGVALVAEDYPAAKLAEFCGGGLGGGAQPVHGPGEFWRVICAGCEDGPQRGDLTELDRAGSESSRPHDVPPDHGGR